MLRRSELPDPDAHPDTDVVVFDGQCRFCRRQVDLLRRLDIGGPRLTYLSLHDHRVAERYPDLSHDQLMEQMYVVDRHGRRHGGSTAVRYLSRRLPLLWIAAPILHFPGSAGLWRRLYQELAKRRYRLAGKTGDACSGDACEVHFD